MKRDEESQGKSVFYSKLSVVNAQTEAFLLTVLHILSNQWHGQTKQSMPVGQQIGRPKKVTPHKFGLPVASRTRGFTNTNPSKALVYAAKVSLTSRFGFMQDGLPLMSVPKIDQPKNNVNKRTSIIGLLLNPLQLWLIPLRSQLRPMHGLGSLPLSSIRVGDKYGQDVGSQERPSNEVMPHGTW